MVFSHQKTRLLVLAPVFSLCWIIFLNIVSAVQYSQFVTGIICQNTPDACKYKVNMKEVNTNVKKHSHALIVVCIFYKQYKL